LTFHSYHQFCPTRLQKVNLRKCNTVKPFPIFVVFWIGG
jgi:hypothetical protein